MSMFSQYFRAMSALTLAILATALIACSSTPATTSNSDPTVDFDRVFQCSISGFPLQ